MTSFAIIPHEGEKVNPQYQKTTEYAQFVRPALTVPLPPREPTIIAASGCKSFDSDPSNVVATSTTSAVEDTSPSLASSDKCQLRDFDLDLDQQLPLTAEQVLFCTSQLGAVGCSGVEVEQFFEDLLVSSPYWYPNFRKEAAKYEKSPAFLSDVCDAFVYSITPCDDYVRLAGQLFHYQRDGAGYEFIACMGTRGGEVVELVVYPHEVKQVLQELAWA